VILASGGKGLDAPILVLNFTASQGCQQGKSEVEVSTLSSFTIFTVIQIALYLKLCVDALSFTVSVWLFARTEASDLYPQTQEVHFHLSYTSVRSGVRPFPFLFEVKQ